LLFIFETVTDSKILVSWDVITSATFKMVIMLPTCGQPWPW